MTLQEIRNSVLARMGVDHEVTPGQIDQFINEGYRIVVARITDAFEDMFGDTESISLAATVNEYTPTKDFLSVRHLEIDYAGTGVFAKATPIDVTDIREFDKITTSYFSVNNPFYYFWGAKIGIVPTPDTTIGTFRIRGIVLPADLSGNSDEPAFTKTHHHILVTWAHAAMVEAVDQNYLDGARKRQQFENELEDLINIVKDKQADMNKKIKIRNLY